MLEDRFTVLVSFAWVLQISKGSDRPTSPTGDRPPKEPAVLKTVSFNSREAIALFVTCEECIEDAHRYLPLIAARNGLESELIEAGLTQAQRAVEVIPVSL